MNLQQLGEEYLSQAQVLSALIGEYSLRAKDLGGIRLYEINRDIAVLREMERDTRLIGKQLCSYYTKNERAYCSHNNRIF